MTTLARTERHNLVELLDKLGPDQPTLCTGWSTRDLAAHIVLRDGRPDASPGIALPFLSGYTTRVQERIARDDWQSLLGRVRQPPLWSIFRIGPIEEAANTTEFFIHHEDVRRAQPGWLPRSLSPELEDGLWRAVTRTSRFLYRHSPVGVELVWPGDGSHVAKTGPHTVTLTGDPGELLLHASGRVKHAIVAIDGPEEGIAALRETRLGM